MGYFMWVFFILTFDALGAQEIEQFVCDETGRFENPTDATCRTFYLCSFTREGDLVQTQYSCPVGSYFSPTNGICSRNFICPRYSVDYIIDTEKGDNVHYHCQDETQYKFKCTRSGRFADLLDSTCKKYHLCSLTENGFYVETELQCPDGTLFDPNSQKCHTKYQCPCNSIDWETSKGKILVSEQQLQKEGRFDGSGFSCTSTDYVKEFECQEAGVFADERDVTCTDYFMCSQLSNGKYVQSFFSCPYGSAFDPIANRCSSRYECSCQIETSTILNNPNKLTTSYTELIPSPQSCFTPKKPFACKKRGRFPNRSDVSCGTYYLCDLSRRGELKKRLYRCPRCLYFNPRLGKCTDDYICPCNAIEGSGQQTTNPINSRSTPSLDTTTIPVTRVTTDCRMPSPSRPFRCTSRGRFPDRRDTSCSSYFLCTSLRRNIFKRSSYKCIRNLKFDPRTQSCSALYECPCSNISMTTSRNTSTISLPTTRRSTISSEPTSSSDSWNITTLETETTTSSRTTVTMASPTVSTSSSITTSTQVGNITTSFSTGTTDDCTVPPIDRPFRCTSVGFFPNRRDTTCSTYFQCYLVRTGSFRRHFHQCRRNLKYDPSLRKCSDRYVCPCETTTMNMTTSPTPTTQRSTISSVPITSPTSLNTTTRSTTQTGPTTNTGTTATSQTTVTTTSPTISTSSSITTSTQVGNTTTSFSTGTTDDCTVPPVDRPFRCTARGRFPDRRDVTCVSYFLCSTNWQGILRRTSARCQRNTRFDPRLQRCSARYVCPCIGTSVTPTQNMSTVSTTERSTISSEPITSTTSQNTTTRPTTQTGPTTNTGTTATSRTTVTTASSTISTSSSITTSTQIGNTTTSLSTGTTDDCTVPPVDRPFRCTARGRFPDRRDVTCVSYFLCSTNWQGILRRTSARCQRNTRFDPRLQRCSARYVCPCIGTSVTPTQNMSTVSTTARSTISSEPITSTTSLNTTTRPTTQTGPATNTGTTATSRTTATTASSTISTSSSITTSTQGGNTITSFSTGTTDDCTVPPINRPFRCRARGRFPDRRDVTCVSYFLCSTNWQGILRRTSARCQRNTRFDPRLQRCSARYVCPCIGTSVTPTQNISTVSLPTTQRSTISSEPITSTSSLNTTTRSTTQTGPSTNTGTTASSRTTVTTASPTISTPSNITTSTQVGNTTTSYSTGTTDDCTVPPIDRPFRCTSVGFFPNRRDTTCSTYFQCYLVRTGSFRRHFHQCRRNLKYDPSLRKCSDRYVCPCETTTMNMTTSPTPTTQRSTISSLPITSPTSLNTTTRSTTQTGPTTNTETTATSQTTVTTTSPTISTSSSITTSTKVGNTTTSFSTGTTDDCTVPPVDRPFRCTARGRFPDRRDVTCVSYFLCSTNWQGILRRTSARCQRNTRFDPRLQRCSARYVCPCIGTSVTPTQNMSTVSTTERSTISSEPITSTTSQNTTTRPTTQTGPTTNTGTTATSRTTVTTASSTISTSSSITTSTQVGNTTTSFSTGTTDDCTVPPVDRPFRCTARGLFPDRRDVTCVSYFLCSTNWQGILRRTSARCQRNTRFDPRLQRCSARYVCPCIGTSVTPTQNMSTVSTTERSTISSEPITSTTSQNTTTRPTTQTGPTTNTGTTATSRTTVTTASSTISTSSSITTSTQGGNTTTSFSTGTTDDCTVPPINRPFRCRARGRFPDRRDVTCVSYFLCSTTWQGIWRRTAARCQRNTKFDPRIQRCSARYVCPCIGTSVTPTQNMSTVSTTARSTISSEPITSSTSLNTTTRLTTQTGPPTNTGTTATSRTTATTASSTSSSITTSTQGGNTITSFSTGTTDDCTVPPINRPFRCRARGRFPDRRDVTCVSYFLCSTNWQGILRRTSARCQRNTRFDPRLQRCSARYVCPCIGTSVTPTLNISTVSLPTTQRSTISSEPITSTSSLNTTTRSTTQTGPSTNTGTTASSRTTVTTASPTISTPSNITTSTQVGNTTTSYSTGTTDDCTVPPIDRPFRCTSVGFFPNRRDTTCSTYFQCYLVRTGSFRRHFHQCRRNLKYDPSLRKCSDRYVCPCETTTMNMTTSPTPTTQRSTISSVPITSPTSLNTTTRSTTQTGPTTNTETTATSQTTVTTTSPTISTSSSITTSTQVGNTTTSFSTGTTDDCTVPPVDRPFRCTARGRFPDRRDVTCVSYFLCSTNWQGILRRTSARCQRNTRFDPRLQRCSARYVCPCIETSVTPTQNMSTVSTTERSTISSEPITSTTSQNTTIRPTTQTGPTTNTGTTATSRTTVTTASSTISTSSSITTSTQGGNTTTSFSTGTTDDCTVPPINRPFRCRARGRFPDRRDVTCVSYFLCSTDWQGILRRISVRCQGNTRFDPRIQRCSARYVCPCIGTSVTPTQNISTVSLPTTQTIYSEPITSTSSLNTTTRSTTQTGPTTNTGTTASSRTTVTTASPTISTPSNITTSTQVGNTTTSFSTGTTDDCTVPSVDRPFRCTARGRFPDRRDVTCVSYFLCSTDWQGILRRISVRCQGNTRFDPRIQRCSARYVCPCIGTSVTPIQNMSTVSTTERSTISSEPITSTTSLNTTTRPTTQTGPPTNTGTTIRTTVTTASPTISSPSNITTSTQGGNTTTSFSTGTTDDCTVPPIDRPFICTARGRFPDRRDVTCVSYFLCSTNWQGILRRTSARCQRNTRFDPRLQRCSARYVCPCIGTSVTPTLNISTVSLPTTQRSTISSEPITSTSSLNTTTRSTTQTGPSTNTGTTASSRTTVTTASPTISTPSNITTSTQVGNTTTSYSTGTTDDCTVPPIDRPFRCTSVGFFPNRRDTTCSTYFQCYLVRTGSFRRHFHQCRRNLKYDPSLRKCSDRYVCPCETTTMNMTTSPTPTTQRSTISSVPITSPTSLNTTTRSTTQTGPTTNTETTATSQTTVTTTSPTISTSSSITTSTQVGNTTTSFSTGTTDECTVPPVDRPFRCTARGRFPDRRDVTCVSYFLCSTNWQGILRRTSARCQRNTRFDPRLQRCSARYVCPCIETSLTPTQNMSTVSTTERSTISSEPITSTTSQNTTTRPTTQTGPTTNTGTTATSRTTVTTASSTISTSSSITTSTQGGNTTTSFSTGTTDDCTVPSINRPFRCRARGRFPDRRDVTCVSYFLCSTNWQGILRRTSARCQRNTRFDPRLQRCSARYVCPCIGTSVTPTQNMSTVSTTARSTISSEPITSSTSLNTTTRLTTQTGPPTNTGTTATSRTTATTASSTSSSITTSTQGGNTITSFSTGTTDDCTVPPINRPFRCRARGRFPDRRDVTCVSYFLCSTNWQGILRRTSARCQRNTRFDPRLQRCSARYVCPCIGTSVTPTLNISTVSLPTTQRSTISSEPITSTSSLNTTTRSTTQTGPSTNTGTTASSRTTVTTASPTISTPSNITTSTQVGNTTTSYSTGTTDDCTVPPIDRPFRCTSVGFFPNRRDTTCSTYFQCYLVRTGSFRRHFHQCRRNLKYDPSLRKCSDRYVCPCETTTMNMTTSPTPTTQRSTISSVPITSPTSLNTTTRSTTQTGPTTNTETTATSQTTVTTTSPTISTSSSITTSTQVGNTTTSFSTGTTDECTVPPVDRPFRCTARGRFPDRRDVTCVSYFLCSTNWQGILRRTSARCQRNTRFDPRLQRCSARYVCPCIETSVTPTQNMSTVSTTERSTISSEPITSTTSQNTTTRPTTQTGPTTNTGTTATSRTTVTTASSTISTSSSITTSTQGGNTTTSFSTGTTDDCTVPSINRPFRCRARGRFPDRRDVTCVSYFLCSTNWQGILRRTSARCQRNTRFDPRLQRCSARYVCPCIGTSVTPTQNISTVSLPTTQTISSEPITSTSSLNTTTRSTTQTGPTTNTGTTASSRTTVTTASPTISTPSNITTSTQVGNTTTSFSTGTTDDCTVPSVDRPFRCTARGRFPDRRDVTCVSYFLCSTDWQGILRRISVRCQGNTRFDPRIQRCSARYVCPCIGTSVTPIQNMSTVSTTERSTISSEPITSTTSLNTTTRPTTQTGPPTNTGTTASSRTTVTTASPTISTPSNITTSTQVGNTTTSFSTGTTDDCTVPPIDRPFRCRSVGFFPNRRDTTCSTYFQCYLVRTGSFRRHFHQCRRNLKYDPRLRKCSDRYVCPCETTTMNMTTSPTPTTQRSTISSVPITSPTSLNTTTRPTTQTGPTTNTGTTSTNRTTVTTPSPTITTSSSITTSTQIGNTTTSFSTGTTDDCTVPPFGRPFRCTSRGRFPDRRDVTCVSYFLCSTDWQGIWRRISVRCQGNTRFDPRIQRCSARYVCPCIGTSVTPTQNMSTVSTTERSTISSEPITSTTSQNSTTRPTTQTGPTTNTGSTTTSRITVTTASPTISTSSGITTSMQIANTTTSFSAGTTDDCTVSSSDRPFRCTSVGFFRNHQDTTCSTYFQCYLVRRGSFRRHFHQCRRNLKFDPRLGKCSANYVCRCETTTSNVTSPTTQRSTISSEPITSTTSMNTTTRSTTQTGPTTNTGTTTTSQITVTTASPTVSTSSSITTSTHVGNTTTSFSTGTTDDCTVPPIDRPFRCTSRGRFPDRRDVFCVSYFLCTMDWQGTLRRTSVRCQSNTRFDPSIQGCSASYLCPCIRASTTSTLTTSSLRTTEASTRTSPTTTSITETAIYPSSEISTSTRSTTDSCVVPSQDYEFICESEGRFPDIADQRCFSYFLCSYVGGRYVQSQFVCPPGSKFDPYVGKCSFLYDCPCDSTGGTTFSSLSTVEACSTTKERFICTETGRFKNPTDLSCCTYYLCSASQNGTILQSEYSCPEGYKFDPDLRQCTEDYTCPCSVTEPIESFTPPSYECDIPTEEFVCTSVGRFPNRQDVSCCNYILCSISETGSFVKFEYSCPEGTTFDPELQRCSEFYQCPCINTEVSEM